MDEYYTAVRALPEQLAGPLTSLPRWQAPAVQEIRLRAGQPVVFTVNGMAVAAGDYSAALKPLERLQLSAGQLQDTLLHLCGMSLHTHEDELSRGYLTIAGGHRVGVGGRYIRSAAGNTPEYILTQAASLNLRIARARLPTLPPELQAMLQGHFGGLALVGEPDSGKTTLLRGIASALCRGGRACAVIDEREELFNIGCPLLDCGADVISGIEKAAAVQMALRTLSPQVLLLDELGEMREAAALRQGLAAGVDFIVTLHAGSLAEAERRPQFQLLRQSGMLQAACLLAGRCTPGKIAETRCY